jgi:peptide deformylase
MLCLMRRNNGIGLAAPQVGITKRLFVCEIEGYTISLINPQISDVGGQAEMIEGCLSLPGVHVNVTRNEQLHVQGYDSEGRRKELKMSGLWARVAQHEIDHLNGVLICDHGKNLNSDEELKGDW